MYTDHGWRVMVRGASSLGAIASMRHLLSISYIIMPGDVKDKPWEAIAVLSSRLLIRIRDENRRNSAWGAFKRKICGRMTLRLDKHGEQSTTMWLLLASYPRRACRLRHDTSWGLGFTMWATCSRTSSCLVFRMSGYRMENSVHHLEISFTPSPSVAVWGQNSGDTVTYSKILAAFIKAQFFSLPSVCRHLGPTNSPKFWTAKTEGVIYWCYWGDERSARRFRHRLLRLSWMGSV